MFYFCLPGAGTASSVMMFRGNNSNKDVVQCSSKPHICRSEDFFPDLVIIIARTNNHIPFSPTDYCRFRRKTLCFWKYRNLMHSVVPLLISAILPLQINVDIIEKNIITKVNKHRAEQGHGLKLYYATKDRQLWRV